MKTEPVIIIQLIHTQGPLKDGDVVAFFPDGPIPAGDRLHEDHLCPHDLACELQSVRAWPLFSMDASCSDGDLARTIAPMSARKWPDAGLDAVDGAMVRACLKILPYHNLLLAFDPPGNLLTSQARDHIIGNRQQHTHSCQSHHKKTVPHYPRSRDKLLSHAFLASPYSTCIYGTDINPGL